MKPDIYLLRRAIQTLGYGYSTEAWSPDRKGGLLFCAALFELGASRSEVMAETGLSKERIRVIPHMHRMAKIKDENYEADFIFVVNLYRDYVRVLAEATKKAEDLRASRM